MRRCRLLGLLICLAGIWNLQAQSPPLTVELRGNYLHLAAPQMHFLEGKPLEQLHNGASVTYVFELTLASDQRAVTRLRKHFVLSFDLWEECFSVVLAGSPQSSGSHLKAALAESWCLDNLQMPLPALGPEKPFVIKLDCSPAPNESESDGSNSSRLTLAGLIDALSRKGRDTSPHWQAISGILHLADLKDRRQDHK